MTLPAPSQTEEYYHIKAADNLVRVVVRRAYAHMGEHGEKLINLRLEARFDTGPETCEWRTVSGSVTGLMDKGKAYARAAEWYHLGWRTLLQAAEARSAGLWSQFLTAPDAMAPDAP